MTDPGPAHSLHECQAQPESWCSHSRVPTRRANFCEALHWVMAWDCRTRDAHGRYQSTSSRRELPPLYAPRAELNSRRGQVLYLQRCFRMPELYNLAVLTKNEFFTWPNDENVKIWRYMDFAKFISLINEQYLYFTRSDRFEDRFEGSYSSINVSNRNMAFSLLDPAVGPRLLHEKHELAIMARRWMFITCWNISDY